MDVSVVAGILVAYEGQRPVYATLCSVGRDRLGEAEAEAAAAATTRGDFDIVAKHITAKGLDPRGIADYVSVYDVPWALTLSSGQLVHGAYWHDRFGIDHGLGNVQLSPADARWLWDFATPVLPTGWHGATSSPEAAERTIVRIRK
jgi:hypothetical protein